MKPYVLALQSDSGWLRPVRDALERDGYDVVTFGSVGELLTNDSPFPPATIIVDELVMGAARMNLAVLNDRFPASGLVVIGDGQDISGVKALMEGADTYLKRSVGPKELVSRVRALLRRTDCDSIANARITVPDFDSIDMPGEVLSGLTETEAKLLQCLAEQQGRIVSRDEAMLRVWGEIVNEGRLRFFIWSLRRKLNASGIFDLETRNGVGYRLVKHPLTA